MIERDRVYWLDPITFEVIRNALTAATDEMALALRRSAYSTNVKTRGDFSCAFFDRDLRVAAQAFTQPVHLGSMVQLVPRAVRAFGPERLTPGDMLITNDPYTGGVHLNDITVIAPVFAGDECFGYVANLAHHVDVGGGAPASIGAFREVFQEGVIIPAVKVVEAAQGIVEIANAAMVNALRLVSVQWGYDPREYALIAFGGAGPVHANRLAAELEIPTTLVPLSPGTTSALGLLVTDLKHDDATTMIRRVDQLDPARVEAAFQGMAARGQAELAREGVRRADVAFVRQAELRYVGQGYELALSLPDRPFDASEAARVQEQFHAAHDRAYGYSAPSEPVELVNLRLTAVGRIAKPRPRRLTANGHGVAAAGRFPAILGRTSYDKNSPQMWVEPVGEFFSRRGYVVVIQDLRGRHHSEGTGQYFHTANPTEGPDGYDTIEWIAAQPWSNGKVGMVGSSHGAIVQQIAALYRPPHLAAIWPDVGPTNIYDHEARGGGAMQLHMFGAQFLHAHDAQEIRDVDFGPTARWGDDVYNRERLRWFDRWLKDLPNGVEDDPPVRIFVMGGGSGRKTRDGRLDHGGQWRSEDEWPLARTRFTPYYLRVDGGLTPAPTTADTAPLQLRSRPAGPDDRRRGDRLLRAGADRRGNEFRLRRAASAHAQHRPGRRRPLTIALPPTSNRFAAGHRVRLDVSSSNFPRFDVNPNTGEPVGRHTYQVVAHNAVYCDPGHPSHVVLPVVA